ncbi:MAG: alpha/beta hydrolase [Tetrasphaera sp.]
MVERALRVPVDRGELIATLFNDGAAGAPVVAIHGITANHRSWVGLAEQLDAPILAVDLRGRGGSRSLPPPYTLVQHADDVGAAIAHAQLPPAVVVGHSMGAFVATRLAERHPGQVAATVLVDGGLPLPPPPPGVTVTLEQALGPVVDRLRMTFPDRAAYRDFYRQHPALGPYWNPQIEAYVDYDLVEVDGQLRPSPNLEAVATNFAELDGSGGYAEALEQIASPRVLLTCPRGLFDETPGLYSGEWLAHWRARLPDLAVAEVPDTNHFTIVFGPQVRAVADAVRSLTAGGDGLG